MSSAIRENLKPYTQRIVRTVFAAVAIALAFAVAAPPAARAQGSRKDDIVFNAQGRPMAGATVRICTASATGDPCTPLANIYSDPGLTQALANPLTTDGLGNYMFYAAPGRYEIEISGPGITTKQMPNVILPNDPSTPTFTTLATTSGITAFSLSLSGNLTVNGSTAVTGTLTEGGAPVATTTPTFITANGESGLPNSRQLVNGTGTTVDTSVAGQIKIDASGAAAFPYSVASYGARSISVNLGVKTNATCTASSIAVTLASNPNGQFQNGDGIFLPGCGTATSLSKPSAPTVTPVALAGAENSGLYVVLTGQSTSYSYCISAEDLGNGHTACSANGTTTSGDATLGNHTATVSTYSLSGNVVTATLTTSPTDLPPGGYVHIMGANPSQFDGWFQLKTVSGNTVTYVQSESSTSGISVATSGTSGTLTWKVANLITLPSGTGAQDFIIYGNQSGSLDYQCISAHDTTGGFQQLWYMDYGSPESLNCPEPAWIPSTPPASALGDGLVTTISSISGTSVTLATAATTSSGTNGATAQYDNCAQIQAAATAAVNNASALYFPPGEWVIGSYCKLAAGVTVNQAGVVEEYNTLELPGTWRWYGGSYASGNQAASFAIGAPSANPVYSESPYPAVFSNGNGGGGQDGFTADTMYLGTRSAKNAQTLLLIEDEAGFLIDRSVFATGEGSGVDDLGSAIVMRGATAGVFDGKITNSLISGGAPQTPDVTWAPAILMQGAASVKEMDNINTGTRGGIGAYGGNGIFLNLSNWHLQGPITPVIQTNIGYGSVNMFSMLLDSSSSSALFVSDPGEADYDLGDAFNGAVSLNNASNPGADTYGYVGAISGLPVSDLVTSGPQYALGQNYSFLNLNRGTTTTTSFSPANASVANVNEPNGPTIPAGVNSPFAFTPPYSTPTATVSSGGSVPVDALCYQYAPIFPSGGLGALSACATATTTSGNQTVTASVSSMPAGAVALVWFRSVVGSTTIRGVTNCWNVGTSCVDTYGFDDSVEAPVGSADGFPHFGSDGVRTPQVTTGALTGALVTKSSAYTLTSSDYWVNVTGTTTITVPHAIVGQHWVVFNSGSNTVTVVADSGNINGGASITLSANTGKEITCDGSNCFAH